jgi:excisionase family DNA binding protein
MLETQLLTVPETSVVLGISERMMWKLVYEREIESIRIGRLVKITKKAIEEYIASKVVPRKRIN